MRRFILQAAQMLLKQTAILSGQGAKLAKDGDKAILYNAKGEVVSELD